ncbi:MAG: TauD/TfdA family dioxygenase [Novosphingobium sp.]|nr:TauD/TfdA family dioxygenase [Novosphingobium sp.]
MASIKVKPLQADLPFGARIAGVTAASLDDPAIRQQINDVFEDRGMIVFENVEQTAGMQVKLSTVFGPLKDHPVKIVERLDQKAMPGVITIRTDPGMAVVEIEGKQLMTWQPWHFDHSYNNELNRAGVLRAEKIASKDGMTAFADGIQIYRDMAPDFRRKIEDEMIIYTLDQRFSQMRFGRPKSFNIIREKGNEILKIAASMPRALHPAVWLRESGEKVFHASPYGCYGILGNETPEGDKLLAEVWDAAEAAMKIYYHSWSPTDMLVWDNWRMLHAACGCDPNDERVMHRTTIKGDYGFGRWETEPKTEASADAMS